jgi:hypothetical protein
MIWEEESTGIHKYPNTDSDEMNLAKKNCTSRTL